VQLAKWGWGLKGPPATPAVLLLGLLTAVSTLRLLMAHPRVGQVSVICSSDKYLDAKVTLSGDRDWRQLGRVFRLCGHRG
jgi:hypothetical protein